MVFILLVIVHELFNAQFPRNTLKTKGNHAWFDVGGQITSFDSLTGGEKTILNRDSMDLKVKMIILEIRADLLTEFILPILFLFQSKT